MIPVKLRQRLVAVCKSVESSKEKFIAIIKEVAAALGGPEWRKTDLKPFWKNLTRETREICVGEGMMSKDAFCFYMGAARKAIIFGVPFRFGGAVPIDDLSRVRDIVDGNTSGVSNEDKLRDAIQQVREERRKVLPQIEERNPEIRELRALLADQTLTARVAADPKLIKVVKNLVNKLKEGAA